MQITERVLPGAGRAPLTTIHQPIKFLVKPFTTLVGCKRDHTSPAPANDGMVAVYSAKWGTFLGCIPADHWDEQCQSGSQSFDCLGFYRDLAGWLFTEGF